MICYHERKSDAGRLDALDGPHDCRAGDLYQSEVVNTRRLYVTQVDVVRLIFDRHQQQQRSIDKLSTAHQLTFLSYLTLILFVRHTKPQHQLSVSK